MKWHYSFFISFIWIITGGNGERFCRSVHFCSGCKTSWRFSLCGTWTRSTTDSAANELLGENRSPVEHHIGPSSPSGPGCTWSLDQTGSAVCPRYFRGAVAGESCWSPQLLPSKVRSSAGVTCWSGGTSSSVLVVATFSVPSVNDSQMHFKN